MASEEWKAEHRKAYGELVDYGGAGTRAVHCLINAGIPSLSAAREANPRELMKLKNFGIKSLLAVQGVRPIPGASNKALRLQAGLDRLPL